MIGTCLLLGIPREDERVIKCNLQAASLVTNETFPRLTRSRRRWCFAQSTSNREKHQRLRRRVKHLAADRLRYSQAGDASVDDGVLPQQLVQVIKDRPGKQPNPDQQNGQHGGDRLGGRMNARTKSPEWFMQKYQTE